VDNLYKRDARCSPPIKGRVYVDNHVWRRAVLFNRQVSNRRPVAVRNPHLWHPAFIRIREARQAHGYLGVSPTRLPEPKESVLKQSHIAVRARALDVRE
jgi:hypothetical protein